MKVYKVIVTSNDYGRVVLVVEADNEAINRLVFRFKWLGQTRPEFANIKLDRLKPATFREQLLIFKRAYSVTVAEENEYTAFIEVMMKDAYGQDALVKSTSLEDDVQD
jgi:hypothetical protein